MWICRIVLPLGMSLLFQESPLYDQGNAKVAFKFRDEFAGSIVEEFGSLKPTL